MPKPGNVVLTPRAETHLFLAKAREFASEARSALEAARNDAAMLNAVHAAISGSDAVTVALAGRRSADPDHQAAVSLLEQVARGSEELDTRVRQLRGLIQKKNLVEYESRRATSKEASDAVQRAERFVEWTAAVVERAGLRPRPTG